jgi:serine protease AprX
VKVIVQATGGNVAQAAAAVAKAGGQVTTNLPLIGGLSAVVPASAITTLARSGSVRTISANSTASAPAATTAAARSSSPSSSSVSNLPSVYPQVVGATALQKAGYKGSGVTVALVDTGVAPLSDISSRMVNVRTGLLGLSSAPCVNFTSEDCSDTYGHGTFIAGLIAGSGSTYSGVAPSANLLSVKVAGKDGSTDVSNVIAAIQWVVSYKDQYGIKVLNLSLGTNSTQSYRIDPFDYAVERAWQAGITVVVSASNLGPAPRTITKPGDDPLVITVGATDDRSTVGLGDDTLPNFSAHGPTAADGLAKPDVVAPGAHLVSLAAPGSTITTTFPSSMAAPYRRGSGTSMATGVVSGLVADMLSKANVPPDRVKYALAATAHPAASSDRMAIGAGVVDGYAAAFNAPAGVANQGIPRSDGSGPLDTSRGSVLVQTVDNVPIVGNLTGQLKVFDLLNYLLGWNPLTYPLSQWAGSNWAGSNWAGSNWAGSNWAGSTWQGTPDPTSTYGSNWAGSAFYGAWDQ